MVIQPFMLYSSLFNFLQDAIKANPELTWHRFHGVYSKEDYSKATGQTIEAIDAQIYHIENWSDYHKIPSITSLMRPVPETLDDMVYSDIHTHLTRQKNMMIQRHFLGLKNDNGTLRIVARDDIGTELTGEFHYIVTTGQVPSVSANILERDLAVVCYGRLAKDLLGTGYEPKIDW